MRHRDAAICVAGDFNMTLGGELPLRHAGGEATA